MGLCSGFDFDGTSRSRANESDCLQRSPNERKIEEPAASSPAAAPLLSLTEKQEARQTLVVLMGDEPNQETREGFADWLEANGWGEDADRLRLQIEQERLSVKAAEIADKQLTSQRKPWRVLVGRDQLDVEVTRWNLGMPVAIRLSWEQADKYFDEIKRMAPIKELNLASDPKAAVEDLSDDQIRMTIMSKGRTFIVEGHRWNKFGLMEDLLRKRFNVERVHLNGGGSFLRVASGAIASGAIILGSYPVMSSSGSITSYSVGGIFTGSYGSVYAQAKSTYGS